MGSPTAKALSFSTQKPLASVNHIEGHIYSVSFEHRDIEFPALALVVSGGHTNLFWVESESGDFRHLKYTLVGKTRDDAAGEAYDKVAKLLGLSYPGGPIIDRLAKLGHRTAFRFSIPKISDHALDFSFSGIKTAVLRMVKENEALKEDPTRLDLCASFQEAVVNMLWSTTLKAAQRLHPRAILLSGGVAANSRLREAFTERSAEAGLKFYYPKPILTTDNAAMIAAAGTAKLMRGEIADIDTNADPNMRLAGSQPGGEPEMESVDMIHRLRFCPTQANRNDSPIGLENKGKQCRFSCRGAGHNPDIEPQFGMNRFLTNVRLFTV